MHQINSEEKSSSRLPRAVEFSHQLIEERVEQGDTVIDATVGNGHDTAFLARLVGAEGKVLGFDTQSEAIEATRRRLEGEGFEARVSLFECCHSELGDRFEGNAKAVIFNLGYLPGGDKSQVTQPETTLAALAASVSRLVPGGLVAVVAYPGHPGGEIEAKAIEDWARGLDQKSFSVIGYRFLNQVNSPPYLIAIERR